ncbi:MAG: hypothetical protein ACYDCK_09385, partial [Thermoplasmatota archaeon]
MTSSGTKDEKKERARNSAPAGNPSRAETEFEVVGRSPKTTHAPATSAPRAPAAVPQLAPPAAAADGRPRPSLFRRLIGGAETPAPAHPVPIDALPPVGKGSLSDTAPTPLPPLPAPAAPARAERAALAPQVAAVASGASQPAPIPPMDGRDAAPVPTSP